MKHPELVGFSCPNCHKVILLTLPSARVSCGSCNQWALQAKPNLTTGTTHEDYRNKRTEKSQKVLMKSQT